MTSFWKSTLPEASGVATWIMASTVWARPSKAWGALRLGISTRMRDPDWMWGEYFCVRKGDDFERERTMAVTLWPEERSWERTWAPTLPIAPVLICQINKAGHLSTGFAGMEMSILSSCSLVLKPTYRACGLGHHLMLQSFVAIIV